MKRSEDLVVLVHRKENWDGPILGVAIVHKALLDEPGTTWDKHPDERIQTWPVTFLGSIIDLNQWIKAELDYHGIPVE